YHELDMAERLRVERESVGDLGQDLDTVVVTRPTKVALAAPPPAMVGRDSGNRHLGMQLGQPQRRLSEQPPSQPDLLRKRKIVGEALLGGVLERLHTVPGVDQVNRISLDPLSVLLQRVEPGHDPL